MSPVSPDEPSPGRAGPAGGLCLSRGAGSMSASGQEEPGAGSLASGRGRHRSGSVRPGGTGSGRADSVAGAPGGTGPGAGDPRGRISGAVAPGGTGARPIGTGGAGSGALEQGGIVRRPAPSGGSTPGARPAPDTDSGASVEPQPQVQVAAQGPIAPRVSAVWPMRARLSARSWSRVRESPTFLAARAAASRAASRATASTAGSTAVIAAMPSGRARGWFTRR